MKSHEFAEIYKEMKGTAEFVDAAAQDHWKTAEVDYTGFNHKPTKRELDRKAHHLEAGSMLQGQLEKLLQDNELTSGQLDALENIRVRTLPDTEIGSQRFEVYRPDQGEGFFGQIFKVLDEAGSGFEARLTGLAQPYVKGVKKEPLPVMLERPKTTDKKI